MEKNKPSAKKRYRTREFIYFQVFPENKMNEGSHSPQSKEHLHISQRRYLFMWIEVNQFTTQLVDIFSVVFWGVTDCDAADQFLSVANGNIYTLTLPFIFVWFSSNIKEKNVASLPICPSENLHFLIESYTCTLVSF